MSKYVISGGNKLYGSVKAQSAKNALLPLISACIMIEGEVTFTNSSMLGDVATMLSIIKSLGGNYSFNNGNLKVDCTNLCSSEMPCELTKKIRASVFMLGPLLARFKNVVTYLPGGCQIGSRPIDMHLDGFKLLGVQEFTDGDALILKSKKLQGVKIKLKYASVGVTENLIMCAVLSEGETVLLNSAKEPEIVCLAKFLRLFGAKIKGEGTSTIVIEGVKKLKSKNVTFMPISDRIEVGTYLLSVLGTGGEIEIENANFLHNVALIKKIYNNACKIILTNDKIYIKCVGIGKCLSYTRTAPYPKFPTDLQTPLCAYATTLNGTSYVEESVFDNRFMQLKELERMGAKISVNGNVSKIEGVNELIGTDVTALDLRGGASLIIAGLKASGQTVIDNAQIIERGYLDIEKKLSLLGADIKKV